jgi:hypothetical protein
LLRQDSQVQPPRFFPLRKERPGSFSRPFFFAP